MSSYSQNQNSDNNDWFEDYDMDYGNEIGMQKGISHIDEPKLTRGFSFTMIEDTEIEPKQKKMINDITETLGVSDSLARALLLNY